VNICTGVSWHKTKIKERNSTMTVFNVGIKEQQEIS